MFRRAFAGALLAAALLPVTATASATEVTVLGPSCTFVSTEAELEDSLALYGVFAANWSAEILRDVPGAAEDMALARAWFADKTAAEEPPAEISAALERIDVAGHRVGYQGQEASAPLRVLVDRNERRQSAQRWRVMPRVEARERLTAHQDTPLHGYRAGLSVAAAESWERAWARTPGAEAAARAGRAEFSQCTAGVSGKAAPPPLPGAHIGALYPSLVMALLEDVGQLKP
ncbi:MAG: hypothetical protein Q4G50_10805 [Corynebacterium sp.]|uniref:hypothetical protein n=1 Tax=Corynebacterium sp. TaxID=1720 RepID=UPI0026DFAC96|nr:hypothetical protein [Corynebacterium sp.]MDO5670485.1 hypothetical protein [Corynebacterium sp.]